MLTAKLILERFDKDYRLLEKRELPSRSFVAGFIRLLYVAHAQIQAAAPYSMNDITNVARNVDGYAAPAGMHYVKGNLIIGSAPGFSQVIPWPGSRPGASINWQDIALPGHNIGIQIGTGVGAVIPTDIALGTKIAHGRAAGQMEYGGCELVNIAFADPNGEFTIRRYFTNLSGGGITVQEVGIYSPGTRYEVNSGDAAWPFCIARDISGAVAVLDTEILRVTYVVQITV